MSNITFEDFQKLDIRMGTITKAEVPEWSHWVMKLTVDLGSELGKRTVFAGIMHFFEGKELEGKQSPFIVNIEPKNIGPKGDKSEGILLMATPKLSEPLIIEGEKVKEKPVLLIPQEKVANGTKVR